MFKNFLEHLENQHLGLRKFHFAHSEPNLALFWTITSQSADSQSADLGNPQAAGEAFDTPHVQCEVLSFILVLGDK